MIGAIATWSRTADVRGIGLIAQRAGRQVRRRPGADRRCALHALLGRPGALREHVRSRSDGPGDRAGRQWSDHARPRVPAAGRRTGRWRAFRRSGRRAGLGHGTCRWLCFDDWCSPRHERLHARQPVEPRARPPLRPRSVLRLRPEVPTAHRERAATTLARSAVTVTQTAAAASGKNQVVRFGLRVKNQTSQPLVLAYKAGHERRRGRAGEQLSRGAGRERTTGAPRESARWRERGSNPSSSSLRVPRATCRWC